MAEVETEEELKRVLKTLFAEKKRVKELEKAVDTQSVHKKFYHKLAHLHKASLAEECRTWKESALQKEQEIADLKEKLRQVSPAIRKLVEALKKTEREALPEHASAEEAEWRERSEQLSAKVLLLEQEKERGDAERNRLMERLSESLHQIQQQIETTHSLREEITLLEAKVEEREEKVGEYEQKVSLLHGKIEESLRLSEMNSLLKDQMRALEERGEQERHTFSLHMREWAQQEKELYGKIEKLERVKEELENHDLTSVRAEYEARAAEEAAAAAVLLEETRRVHLVEKEELIRAHDTALQLLHQQFKEVSGERDQVKAEYTKLVAELPRLLEEKEKVLEQAYEKMRELSTRHADNVEKLERAHRQIEEREQHIHYLEQEVTKAHTSIKNAQLHCEGRNAEIRKAQQHLAKKVKETALLRDLVERQKEQVATLQGTIHKQKEELEQVRHHLEEHTGEERRLEQLLQERTQAEEARTKEWHDARLSLQKEVEGQREELAELYKLRDNYDQMVATVASLKTILGKSAEG